MSWADNDADSASGLGAGAASDSQAAENDAQGSSSSGRGGGEGGGGGWGGFSQADIDRAMAQSDDQARANNAERGMAHAGMGAQGIGDAMQALMGLSPQDRRAAQDKIADANAARAFADKSLIDKFNSWRTAKKVGQDTGFMGKGLAMSIGGGILDTTGGMTLGPALSALGAKVAGIPGALLGNVVGDEAANSLADYALDDMTRSNIQDYARGIDPENPGPHSSPGTGTDFEKQEIHGILDQIAGESKPSRAVQRIPVGPPAPSRLQNFMATDVPNEISIPSRLMEYIS